MAQTSNRDIPPYGELIARMVLIGGLVWSALGAGFLVMLGIAGGSTLAIIIFGTLAVVGLVFSWLAGRDLAAPVVEKPAIVTALRRHAEGGNPNYELKFRLLDISPTQPAAEKSYNLTRPDFERFRLGDRILVSYSAHFKLLRTIRLVEKVGS